MFFDLGEVTHWCHLSDKSHQCTTSPRSKKRHNCGFYQYLTSAEVIDGGKVRFSFVFTVQSGWIVTKKLYYIKIHHYSLITIHSSLFTHHYSLITIHSSLFTHHYSLITIHSSLFTHHYSLITPFTLPTLARGYVPPLRLP